MSDLWDPFPWFLSHLDSEPDRAWAGCHDFAHRVFRAINPAFFRDMSREDREDLIADLILDLRKDDFRKLRGYRNQGLPFAVWLLSVARHKAVDFYRQVGRRPLDPLSETLVHEGSSADERAAAREELTMVRACLADFPEDCRVLIAATADGYKPRELARLLGLSPGENKQVGDRVSRCRTMLRRCLQKGRDDRA